MSGDSQRMLRSTQMFFGPLPHEAPTTPITSADVTATHRFFHMTSWFSF